jgi:phosphatidylinositol alpha-1,6-mannosyltransferase
MSISQERRLCRVLVISRNLPPLIGGMEGLIWHIVIELAKSFSVSVIGPRGCRSKLPLQSTAMELPARPLALFMGMSNLLGLREAIRRRPHAIVAGSGLTAPISWFAARLVGSKCVVYLHGLDIEANHPLYRLLWRPIFRRCDLVFVNSRFTRKKAYGAGIPAKRIVILHPGVSAPNTNRQVEGEGFRARHGLDARPIMLYVGRITPRKGLAYFCERIMPTVIAAVPEAVLVVIGDEAVNALLKQGGEKTRAERALAKFQIAKHALFLGEFEAQDPELSAAYFAADVLIFPVQEKANDNEGFGMVAIEAAAHGLPTVAFAAGGVPDAIQDGISGNLIESGDHMAFANAVIHRLTFPADRKTREEARAFAKQFEWSAFGERLRSRIEILVGCTRQGRESAGFQQ